MQIVNIPKSKNNILKFIVIFDVDNFGSITNMEVQTFEANSEKFKKRIIKAVEKV